MYIPSLSGILERLRLPLSPIEYVFANHCTPYFAWQRYIGLKAVQPIEFSVVGNAEIAPDRICNERLETVRIFLIVVVENTVLNRPNLAVFNNQPMNADYFILRVKWAVIDNPAIALNRRFKVEDKNGGVIRHSD